MKNLLESMRIILKFFMKRGIEISYSQDGEDVLVSSLLRGTKGTYVDVGAYHPIHYSNTYHFYKKGWKGIAIDPNPAFKNLYSIFRSRDTFVCSGVGSVINEKDYYMYTDGAYNTFSKERANELATQNYPKLSQVTKRSIRPLGDILKETGIEEIDFLSVDVEGLEIEVLNSHNWQIRPKVIAIEDNTFNFENLSGSAVYTYLSEKGYTLAAGSPRTPIFLDSREKEQ